MHNECCRSEQYKSLHWDSLSKQQCIWAYSARSTYIPASASFGVSSDLVVAPKPVKGGTMAIAQPTKLLAGWMHRMEGSYIECAKLGWLL